MKKDPRYVSSYSDDYGNRISDYELLKSSADTPEDKQQFEDIELKELKKKQIRFTDHGFVQDNGFGEAIIKKGNFKDAYKNNRDLRKEVKKILKYDSKVNEFFRTKNIDKFLEHRNKKQKPFETALDNVQKPKIVPTLSTSSSVSVNPYASQDEILKLTQARLRDEENRKLFDTSPDNPGVNNINTIDDLRKHIKTTARASINAEDEQMKKIYGSKGVASLGDWNYDFED